MYKISWTNSEGKKCVRDFEIKENRTLFAELLYVNDMDKLGKISVSRPKRALDGAKAWALKDNLYASPRQ